MKFGSWHLDNIPYITVERCVPKIRFRLGLQDGIVFKTVPYFHSIMRWIYKLKILLKALCPRGRWGVSIVYNLQPCGRQQGWNQ